MFKYLSPHWVTFVSRNFSLSKSLIFSPCLYPCLTQKPRKSCLEIHQPEYIITLSLKLHNYPDFTVSKICPLDCGLRHPCTIFMACFCPYAYWQVTGHSSSIWNRHPPLISLSWHLPIWVAHVASSPRGLPLPPHLSFFMVLRPAAAPLWNGRCLPGMLVDCCDPSTLESEARGLSQVWVH